MAEYRILVLADDLTGALEVGAKFAAAGVISRVVTGSSIGPAALQDATGILVVDTETRHASAAEASHRVHDLACAARAHGFSHVYKKTDSTLRGNIAAEIAALMKAYADSSLLYVPAYPRMGRTARDGSLYVNGVLVAATCFARDPFNPVNESHLPSLLATHCRMPVWSGAAADVRDLTPPGIAVCDGESDADVEAAAIAFMEHATFRLAAGPAGFAEHLARHLNIHRSSPAALPSVRHALIINGSLNPVALQQVDRARQAGFKSVESESISRGLLDGGWIILQQRGAPGEATLEFAKSLARSVCQLLERFPLDALVVFGGDTAYAIVEALAHPPLHVLGEVMEGVPISRIAAAPPGESTGSASRDLYLITKAGSFGDSDILASLRSRVGER